MAKSVDDRGRGARMARRDEGAYSLYVTEEQRSPPGCSAREGERLSHSRALSRKKCTRRSRRVLSSLSIAAVISLCGCSSSSGSPENIRQEPLELYSWWTHPGESDALSALLQVYKAKFHQTEVINAAVQDINNAHEQLRTRMLAGQPPDTFQAVGGGDLMQWVVANGQDATDSKMESVDSIALANHWASVIPKPILDLVSYNGKMYGAPLAVHRTNVLFYNKTVFDQYGLTPPTTWPGGDKGYIGVTPDPSTTLENLGAREYNPPTADSSPPTRSRTV